MMVEGVDATSLGIMVAGVAGGPADTVCGRAEAPTWIYCAFTLVEMEQVEAGCDDAPHREQVQAVQAAKI